MKGSRLGNAVRVALGVTGGLLLQGCATIRYIYKAPYPPNVAPTEIVAASVSVLQDNGFVLNLVNDKVGVVTTEWKSLTSGFAQGLSMALGGTASARRIKLSISVAANTNTIKIQPFAETANKSLYGQSSTERSLNEAEQKLVKKIATGILDALKIPPEQLEILQEKDN